MPILYVYPKRGSAFSVELSAAPVTIGRAAENVIPLSDPFCSGRHAVIRPGESGYVIEDSGSKNGTFLNGRRIEAAEPLTTGDEVRIGGVRILFDRPPAARVEMTDDAVGTTHVNTVVPLQDLLRRSAGPAGDGAAAEIYPGEREIALVIGEVSQALFLHRPLRELLEHIMGLIGSHVSMDRGVLMLREGRSPELKIKAVRVNNVALQSEKIEVSRSIVTMAYEQKLSVIITDASADPRFMARESIVQAGIRSALCVPLWDNKEVIGVLYADRLSLMRPFTERDLRLLTLLANLAAVKIENALLIEDNLKKEQMERELTLAAKIQRDLLPKEIPACAQLDLAGRNDPCQQVGGDYYDFIPIAPCRIGIALADVSGKGVSAALLMASLRAALHSELRPDYDLARLAAKLNDFVHKSTAINGFITFFFGELDTESGIIRYVNAGHPAPLLLGAAGEPRALDGTGLALGMLPHAAYEIGRAEIRPGDMGILYTDGITESRDASGEEYGPERLAAVGRACAGPAAAVIESVFEDLKTFTGGGDPADDRTLVIVRRLT
jgi:phosphoserine phosphatase RsbU/P